MPRKKALLCAALIFVLAALPALAEGFKRVTDGDKYALADASGFLLTDYIYDEIYCYNTDPPFRVSRDGYAGYIDETGYEVVPVIYDRLDTSFREGLAPACLNDRWGYVDTAGRLVIGPWFDKVDQFSEGLAAVEQADKWGYIARSGRFVVEPQFDFAEWFHSGYAQVHLDGKTGLIDQTGAWVLEPEFEDAEIRVDEDGLVSVTEDYGESFRHFDLSSGTAVEVKSVGSGIDLSDYMPFEGKRWLSSTKSPPSPNESRTRRPFPAWTGPRRCFPCIRPSARRCTRRIPASPGSWTTKPSKTP